MAGYIHIFRSDVATGTYGSPVTEFQFTYTTGGNSYARTFDEPGLEEFLLHDVGFPADTTDDIMNRARLHGNVTVADVNLRESEFGALRLQQMPSDT